MSRPLDNVNPTIFASTGPTTSRRTKSAKALLWDEDAAEYQEFAADDSVSGEEEREEIDSEEVFGESRFSPSQPSDTLLRKLLDRSVEVDHRPGTPGVARAAPRGQPG